MRKFFFVFFLLLFLSPAVLAQGGKPSMVIDQPTYDAGVVIRKGAPIDHTFVVKNTGTAELQILEVKPGCGCTVTKFDKVIAPGGQGKIFASVDIEHMKGPIKKSIFIRTNDPSHAQATLNVKADIKVLVDIKPSEQLSMVVNKGGTATKELILSPDPSVHLLNPVVESDLVTASLAPAQNGMHRLSVQVKNTAVIGTHATEIRIPVKGPISEINIPVVVNVRGPLEVIPRLVSFMLKGHPAEVQVVQAAGVRQAPDGTSKAVAQVSIGQKLRVLNETSGWYQVITEQKPATKDSLAEQKIGWIQVTHVKTSQASGAPEPQDVSIRIAKGKTFRLLEVRSTLPSIKVQNKDDGGSANSHELSVVLQAADRSKKGTMRGEILVQTDHPDQPQIRIPVFVNVM